MKSEQTLFSVNSISKVFKTPGGKVSAIKDANFDIPEGSFTIIYGPSGSGKSTLLNCLVGLDAPTEGSVLYQEKDIYAMSSNERAYFRAHTLGMVYQTSHWVHSLNVLENVALPLTFLGMTRRDALKGAMDSLVRVNMQNHARQYPFDLSGGEQKRIAVARATANNPTCIVADEPTGNLDTQNGDEIIELLRYMNKELYRTIILVTHNLAYLPVGDQLISLRDGKAQLIAGTTMHQVAEQTFRDTWRHMKRWRQES